LRRVFDGFFKWQRAFERRTFDKLHDQVVRSDIIKLTDVGMVQGRHRSGLILEALRELSLRNFDSDDAAKPCVPRLIHFAHSAGPDRRKDLIGPRRSPAESGIWVIELSLLDQAGA
jgi:hypothetical protein